MEPAAFLRFAKELCTKTNDEAALRSAVSRGYYGLFNLLKRFVEEHMHPLPKHAEAHKTVYLYLNHCGLGEIVEVAGNLNELREDRNDADYNLTTEKFKDSNLVTFVYLKAKQAHDTFEAFCGNSKNRQQLIRGISEYKKKTNS